MDNNFEKELNKVLHEEKEMPAVVRQSLDNTYYLIRNQAKKDWKVFWKRGLMAACCLIIAGSILTNESVAASIKAFFNFNDKGIQRAVNEGFLQQNSSFAVDKNIKVALDSYFYDSNKMGLSFKLKFNDTKPLLELKENKIEIVSLFFSIRNGNGEYIEEFTAAEKPLKGKNNIISSISEKNSVLDIENGEVQYDVVLESVNGAIPKLENAVIEVESVNVFEKSVSIFDDNNKRKVVIDGTWNLSFNDSNQENFEEVEYAAQNSPSGIEIISAKASPTSFNLKFSINTLAENKKWLSIDMKLVDEKGEEYVFNSFDTEEKEGKTIITTNFPVSCYENAGKYKLLISDIGEFEDGGKVRPFMPDAEIELIKE